jgi:DNA-binding transcriptional regulator YhcF (GntR family)
MGSISCGALLPGDLLPTVVDIAARYSVAASTVQRAFELLSEARLIKVSRGRRAIVTPTGSDV